MRFLITAGPTREYLDDVRFLTNASSGRMGYALARAALASGYQVTLVSGPVAIAPPDGCDFVPVRTTQELLEACERVWPECAGVIGAAAVCDYRPKIRATGKMKKTGGPLLLELVETPDVLAALGRQKENQFVVGFALESQDARENALRKLRGKRCDAIVLNAPTAIDADENTIELIDRHGVTAGEWSGSKTDIADRLIAWISQNLIGPASDDL